jgi:hypothetical protein
MKRLIVSICFLLAGCAGANSINSDYHGKDAGVLMVSESTTASPFAFMLHYRKTGDPSAGDQEGGDGMISYTGGGLFADTPDFSDPEKGRVTIQHLKPGTYEIYSYEIYNGNVVFYPTKNFSIRFAIRPDQTTYIGHFQGTIRTKDTHFLGLQIALQRYFVVTDTEDRDVEIARKKDPNLPPVVNSVPDVSKIGLPEFQAREIP